MRILLTLITVVCLSVTSWGQQNEKPRVWVIVDSDLSKKDYPVFFDPFMKSLKTLGLGNRLKDVRGWSEPRLKAKHHDFYVVLVPTSFEDGMNLLHLVWGRYDSCGYPVYQSSTSCYWQGNANGIVIGYEIGNKVAIVISKSFGFSE